MDITGKKVGHSNIWSSSSSCLLSGQHSSYRIAYSTFEGSI